MNKSSVRSYSTAHLCSILRGRPQATANLAGSTSYPGLSSTVRFYQTDGGVIVLAEVSGLPKSGAPCREQIFGFHIHEGNDCNGSMDEPFADSMSHYNPGGYQHPHHAGDLPSLFGNDGYALSLFLTVGAFVFLWLQYDYESTTELSGVYNLVDSQGNVVTADLAPDDVIRILEELNHGDSQEAENP